MPHDEKLELIERLARDFKQRLGRVANGLAEPGSESAGEDADGRQRLRHDILG